MIAPVFVDTNIFLYAHDTSEPVKQPRAAEWLAHLWREQLGRTSVQVLNEYYFNATHKLPLPLSREEAWTHVQTLFSWSPLAIDADLVRRAFEIERRYRLGWWDSLIVGAAQAQTCAVLLTEDLQEGANYGGVIVRNPFTLGVAEAAAEYSSMPVATHRYRGRGRPRRTSFAATG